MATQRKQPDPRAASVKGALIDAKDSSRRLEFQYNPDGWSESKQVSWSEAAIPGGNDELATFGAGKSLSLGLQLMFNVYGEEKISELAFPKRIDGSSGGNDMRSYVEECLQFLYSFTEKQISPSSGQYENAPRTLFLSIGRVRFPGAISSAKGVRAPALPVRIESMDVKRLIFGKDMLTLRATADIKLARHVGFPR